MSASLVAVFISDPDAWRNRWPALPRICRHVKRGHRRLDVCFIDHHANALCDFCATTSTKNTGSPHRIFERGFNGMLKGYDHALRWGLSEQPLILCVTILTAALSVYMFGTVSKGFFPQQDTGRSRGFIQADQDNVIR